MTNHWNDLQHSDVILIIGCNPAENHPISFKWIHKAKERGAKVISVDPRYTRTSTQADLYAPLRSGTDIAFIGGIINYALQNNLYHHDYVVNYTNASFLVDEGFNFEDGLFSGYDELARDYDKSTWTFQKDEEGNILKDETLQHPRSVFQLLKKHYARYDVDTVTAVTGTPKDVYLEVAKTFCSTSAVDKTGTLLYAMGATQHSKGTQNVRVYAMLQLLLGNIGRPGGGVNALRGESNVQGSTDFGLLYHQITGYMNAPFAAPKHATLEDYLKTETPPSGFKTNTPKWLISMLKAFYGPNATPENEFGYHYLPKHNKDCSHIALFESMLRGEIEGALLFGQNPIVGGPNATKEHKALANLKWMVAVDLWETETSVFWKEKAGSNPAEIQTEVFFLPACSSYEKEGTVTNSGRWMQYRWQAIPPKGESKADLEIVHMLARRIQDLYKTSTDPKDKPIQSLFWNYGESDHPDMDLVHREINGYETATGKLLKNFTKLADDGSTICGNWIYSGFYPEEGKDLSMSQDNTDEGMGNFQGWGYAWPMNRRILYNRASCDPSGKPWSENKKNIWWDAAQGKWVGYDIPDFGGTKAPDGPGGTDAFIMQKDGKGAIFGPVSDGPFPEHYEPFESPVPNAFSSINFSPTAKVYTGDHNPKGDAERYPIVATTYRVSEHWQSGSMTRNQEWLSELMPHMFVEIGEDLAQEKGIKNKDRVIVESARGNIEAYALVTKRLAAFTIRGKKVHQLGMPWQYGFQGIATGDNANRLTPHVADPNAKIPEYKAFLCDIRRAD